MHEVGILSAMLTTIEGVMEKEHLSHVEKIVLEVGEISGVVPHYIEECFPAAAYKTRFEDTKLEMIVIPGVIRCNRCGEEFNAYACDLKCPKCKNDHDFTPLTGREFSIKEIVAC